MLNCNVVELKDSGANAGRRTAAQAMRRSRLSLLPRFMKDESGNVILWVICVMLIMLMMSAFFLDVVHAMIVQRQLQLSADAAALAAAETLPNSNYSTVGLDYSGSSGDRNSYTGATINSYTLTPLCLTTVSGWGATCTSSIPNAIQVKQSASVPAYFSQLFGVPSITVSATSTAAAKGATPLPYNVAILVDSTLSMNAADGGSSCGTLTQEQCALQGVQALLGNGGGGTSGLAPSVDSVALFTFPNVATGSSAGVVSGGNWQCTTTMPSSYKFTSGTYSGQTANYMNLGNGMGYASVLQATYNNSTWHGSNEIPYPGVAWALPYTFPPVPTGTTGYTPPSGTLGPTYEIIGFSNDYRTSDTAANLNTSSNLVKATGAASNCGGLQPSNYDGDYGTYYAGAMYAAQAALLAEQAADGNPNVMIILGDGNNNGPGDQESYDDTTPSVGSSSAEITSTFRSTSQLTYTPAGNTAAYTYPSGWLTASSSGNYPSWVGTCGQAVTAATSIKNGGTQIYTIAYGAPATSTNQGGYAGNCPYDVGAGSYPGITPCQTMQWMASGGSSSESEPSAYFFSDYDVSGGDANCTANSANNSITQLVDIFTYIASSLSRVRLIPNNTP